MLERVMGGGSEGIRERVLKKRQANEIDGFEEKVYVDSNCNK